MGTLENYDRMVEALETLSAESIMWDVTRVLLGEFHHDTWKILPKDSSTWGTRTKHAHAVMFFLVERDGKRGLTRTLQEGERALDNIEVWAYIWMGAVEGPVRKGYDPREVFIPLRE